MKTKRKRVLGWVCTVLFFVVILWGVGSVQAQTIGKTIDKSNVQEYKDLLIPALSRAVERGDFILPTANLGFPYKQPDFFLAASEKNAGKFDVNEQGDLIDKTGKFPKYNIYGFPFPKVDPKDPRAGDKIMWNFNFHKYRHMATFVGCHYMWIGKESGLERDLLINTHYLYFQGRPPGQELKNPQGFLYNEMDVMREPMSMRGTNTLNWEYMDERSSTVFAYVPAIRRARQASGVARSDSFMGSDGWQDSSEMWGGKNRTMKWKLVGEKTILVPFASLTKEVLAEAPDGVMSMTFHDLKWGFATKGWKGAPWCPTGVTWVPRPVWVVEQMPKDPYYNWGLHINYVDKETNGCLLKEVYDKAGQFRTWLMCATHYGEGPSGNNNVGHLTTFAAIDEKAHHASIGDAVIPPNFHVSKFLPSSKLGPDFFLLSHFLQLSK
jgi:hypothetical protein